MSWAPQRPRKLFIARAATTGRIFRTTFGLRSGRSIRLLRVNRSLVASAILSSLFGSTCADPDLRTGVLVETVNLAVSECESAGPISKSHPSASLSRLVAR